MSLNMEPLTLENEYFHTMEHNRKMEKMLFNGTYTMKHYKNPHSDLEKIVNDYYNTGGPRHFHCKQIYVSGNILYKTDEPEIDSMIDLIIKCTYEHKLPSYVDTSVKNKIQLKDGTICPTKEVAFRYKGKLFILYGRYIYGYDIPYVHFVNENSSKTNKSEDSDEEEHNGEEDEEKYADEARKDALLTPNEMILPTVTWEKNSLMNDYNYCFSILDEATEEVQAFAVYC